MRRPVRVRAGEADRVDVHVQRERLAGLVAVAGHDVEHARRQAGLDRQLGQAQRGERALLARLEDHRVAARQRRPELPGGHDHRVVPGHDDADHAHRFARDQRQRVRAGGRDLVVDLVHRLGVPGDRARGGRHVDRERVLDRLAHVDGLEQRELVLARRGSSRRSAAGSSCAPPAACRPSGGPRTRRARSSPRRRCRRPGRARRRRARGRRSANACRRSDRRRCRVAGRRSRCGRRRAARRRARSSRGRGGSCASFQSDGGRPVGRPRVPGAAADQKLTTTEVDSIWFVFL